MNQPGEPRSEGPTFDRPLLAVAGVLGAVGVGAAAAASHGGKPDLMIAAEFCLFHAPALIGLSLVGRPLARIAGWVLVVGLVLFAGDLAMRDLAGHSLFPLAAPAGGIGLIAGWLLIVALALVRRL